MINYLENYVPEPNLVMKLRSLESIIENPVHSHFLQSVLPTFFRTHVSFLKIWFDMNKTFNCILTHEYKVN